MERASVDPRDTRVEIEQPTYRVYFWAENGGESDEYEVTAARSVTEVLEWAESYAATRSFVVYLAMPTSDGPTLARLHTSDPNAR